MNVKKTNLKIKDKKYNQTIMDGEYVYIKEKNKFIYLIFDCMYYGNQNMRNETNFINRLNKVDEII